MVVESNARRLARELRKILGKATPNGFFVAEHPKEISKELAVEAANELERLDCEPGELITLLLEMESGYFGKSEDVTIIETRLRGILDRALTEEHSRMLKLSTESAPHADPAQGKEKP